ncbi:hypothetical protein B0T17DRAFT_409220 [Bombardia bombarda]|uniref:Uncharacterized protein n=1 Tax=Bombardia bombarda TaxID=252184 RepID=A0AA39WD12_9PEZI|nr:hypothetical protein B0T17DRAFT_409220 [Bombardia bombarda]
MAMASSTALYFIASPKQGSSSALCVVDKSTQSAMLSHHRWRYPCSFQIIGLRPARRGRLVAEEPAGFLITYSKPRDPSWLVCLPLLPGRLHCFLRLCSTCVQRKCGRLRSLCGGALKAAFAWPTPPPSGLA